MAMFKIYHSDFSQSVLIMRTGNKSQELLTFELMGTALLRQEILSDIKLNIGSSDISVEEPMKASIYKSQLNYVDSESYTCYVHDNRMVFFSDQSETSTAVGLIES
jgi:hypothetical protein